MSPFSAFIRTAVILAASACSAALAVEPVCVDPGGIGGTGAPLVSSSRPAAAAPGIGGTGAPLTRAPGGMGGTGDPAGGGIGGTGIVGTITGFASICVNGVEVHYGNDVPVRENGLAASLERLAVGQVVALEAGTSGRGLEARSITIVHALEGPVSSLPDASGSMQVMGQTVLIAADARVPSRLRPGEPVRVSGLRNARGEVVATRIDRAPGLSDASAVGLVRESGRLDGLQLAGQIVPNGREMLVRGRWNGTALEVRRAEIDPSAPFAGRVREALVEGLVHEHAGGRLELGGFSVRLEAGAFDSVAGAERLSAGRRVRVSGEFLGSREIKASRIEILRPEREKQRGSDRGSSKVERDDDKRASEARESKNRTDSDRRDQRETDEREDRPERRERIETDERSDRSERVERSERSERSGRTERTERIERVEKPEKVEKLEKRERLERTDRTERVDRIDRPEHD